MVTDIVRRVVGDRGDVTGLMGEGVDPHLYKPTRSDVKQLTSADVVFYSGLKLEGRMADLLGKLSRRGTSAIAVTDALDKLYYHQESSQGAHEDPHVWMDVSAWSQCAAYAGESLAAFDPAGADYYRENAARCQTELAELDEYVKRVIASIPKPQRVLVTAHDAFGYFSRAYDIPVRSVQGLSTDSEAGVDDINKLVDFVAARRIGAVFVESSVSEKNVQALIEGAARRGQEVRIGGELFSDAMGRPGTYEGTYVGMIDHNATTIARALGGEAPERGFRGDLAMER
jgi:manganese/zinc/iron transport system substrate-binding protein